MANKQPPEPADPLRPTLSLLVKLGSIVVHVDEFLCEQGHYYDEVALEQMLQDPEVVAWVWEMTERGLLPVKR